MAEYLAHSEGKWSLEQTYRDHINNVCELALCNARKAAGYYSGDRVEFEECVHNSALYHDLGKLDSLNQEILKKSGEKQGSTFL